MTTSHRLPHRLMLAIAFLQGLMLFGLYRALDSNTWPHQAPVWLFALFTITIVIPLLCMLSLEAENKLNVARYSAGFGVLLTLPAVYTGYQTEPFQQFPIAGLSLTFIASMALASFKALMYLQQQTARRPMSYQALFTFSWRNFLVTALSVFLVFMFWLILVLWGALFEQIGIIFFKELFKNDWFLIPVLSTSFGAGVIVFRNLTHVIDNITKLLHGLFRLLLPLVIFVAVIFLLSLAFTGLELLWSTRRGSGLLLLLLAIILFSINAVYQDGRQSMPYPDLISKLIYAGLLSLPVLSMLSLYGLWLRINQYGWTVERSWAVLIWLLLTLFAVGYVLAIIKHKSNWPSMLARVNTIMGLVTLALMLLVNSPWLDFRKISLHSQVNRVKSGQIDLKALDFSYISESLARPGYIYIENVKQQHAQSDPELIALIDTMRIYGHAQKTPQMFWAQVIFRPNGFEVPARVKQLIEESYNFTTQDATAVLKIDLNQDSISEYVALQIHAGADNSIYNTKYYYLSDGEWIEASMHVIQPSDDAATRADQIKEGSITVIKKKFDSLKLGEIILQPDK